MTKHIVDHAARAKEAWPILVDQARSGANTISYGDLCKLMKLHHRAAGYFLGVIQVYCHKNGLPKLQALAVNKRSKVPGDGYAGARGSIAHGKELERVRAHKWPLRAPNF